MTHPPLRAEPLEDRSVPVTLPTGFAESVLAAGLTNPTQMTVAPDGRVFVAEQGGALRVVQNGALLPTPFVSLTVDSAGERGLIGVALDPNFETNGFVYLYHTVPAAGSTPAFNQVSRFTATGNVAAPGSEVDLLNLDPLSAATNHNGGPLQFGPDGKLYIAVGENANPPNSQSLSTRLGKVLRINPDGSIPADNPTTFDRLGGPPTGANRAIWATGLRNPFGIAFQPGTGLMYINDVGQSSFEEIDAGRAGADYGWGPPASVEGPSPPGVPGVTYPVYSYPHAGTQPFAGIAITGGTFYDPATALFPAGYVGSYFFADLTAGWIDRLDPATGAVANLATGLTGQQVTDLDVGPGGQLLYLARNGAAGTGAVYQITFSPPAGGSAQLLAVGTGAGTAAVAKLVDATGAAQLTVSPFGTGFTGGARVAAADVTGDGVPDLIVGAGPGGGPQVSVYDGATGKLIRTFFAFDVAFTGGVFVAAADFNGDGRADIVVSPDVGGGPRVEVFSGADGSVLANFFGIADPNFRGGVRVATGDVNGDGAPDLAVAAGAGGGPRVAVFDGLTVRPGQTLARLINDFFAFDDTLRNGVYLAAGNTDGDRFADLVVGAGPGGGPRVIILSGAILPTAGVSGATTASFFAGDPASRGGVPVAARNVNSDPLDEVITGTAGGAAPRVSVYKVANGTATAASSFLAFDAAFLGGVFVG
ncbi:MAG: yliI 1 [Gemmataceae bacterium]|nr:yliI 1 [Gemmataceae bacterium]